MIAQSQESLADKHDQRQKEIGMCSSCAASKGKEHLPDASASRALLVTRGAGRRHTCLCLCRRDESTSAVYLKSGLFLWACEGSQILLARVKAGMMAVEQAASSLCHEVLYGVHIGTQSPPCEKDPPLYHQL